MTVYLYGLLRAPVTCGPLETPGVDGADVGFFEDAALAGIVSELPEGEFKARRGDLVAHSDVLQEVASVADVLPMRFGTVFSSTDELTNAFLRPNQHELTGMLERLRGTIEVQVKGDYEPDAIGRDIVSGDRAIQKLQARAASRGDVDSKIELGRRFAALLDQARYADGRDIVGALEPLSTDVSVAPATGEYGVVNAAFLVPRSDIELFDRAVEELQERLASRVKLRLLGPLPPYSFVDAGSLVVG